MDKLEEVRNEYSNLRNSFEDLKSFMESIDYAFNSMVNKRESLIKDYDDCVAEKDKYARRIDDTNHFLDEYSDSPSLQKEGKRRLEKYESRYENQLRFSESYVRKMNSTTSVFDAAVKANLNVDSDLETFCRDYNDVMSLLGRLIK